MSSTKTLNSELSEEGFFLYKQILILAEGNAKIKSSIYTI